MPLSESSTRVCVMTSAQRKKVMESFLNSDHGEISRALAVFENRLNPAISDCVMLTLELPPVHDDEGLDEC